MHWYFLALSKYATFSGRSRRKEYWLFFLFNIIITMALVILDMALGVFDPMMGLGILSGIYSLAVLIPGLSVTVRRLHDSNRTGWWVLVAFVPLVGAIVLLVFMVLDGTRGTNLYGVDPKAAAA